MEIIKPSLPITTAVCSLAVLLAANSASAADLTLQKVPALTVEKTAAYPQNLARYRAGARVDAGAKSQPIAQLQLSSASNDSNGAEAALLCDDPTVGYPLPAGSTTLIVALPKVEN
ncbi:MAG: hypothetical protein M3Y86_08040, partial [Verrucomicrobiota bacterium]|nr:hypothetical protein [Verrucomicrobiota bacterium]